MWLRNKGRHGEFLDAECLEASLRAESSVASSFPGGRVRYKSFSAAAALISLCCGALAITACQSSANQKAPASVEADRAAIERLHQQDMAASKNWDVETLVSLWTGDIVALRPDAPPTIGKEAARAQLLQMKEQSRDLVIEDYKLDFQEVKIVGDWAYEWGYFSGTMRPRAGGDPIMAGGKVMRVLQRQPGGSWKVARTMYATDPLRDQK
jgi:ketosteroid isomerase-like protein